MNFKNYLFSNGLTLSFIGLAAVLLFFFLTIQMIPMGFVLFSEATLILFTVLWIEVSFFLQRKRYLELQKIIEQLPEKYLIGEVLPKPHNDIECMYFEIMKTISSDAIKLVEQARQDRIGYELFVESWVHEMKTPLTAGSLILENGGDVVKLRREIKRADNITENILYYARLKNPEKDTLIRKVQVSDVIEDTLKDQMPLLTAAGISAEVNGAFVVYTDDKALEFIIKQLLSNSAKYCPNCHITINAENSTICYEDNGIGIPMHEISRVTDCGFTGTNGRKIGNSTGMGLYLVKEMCQHLNIKLKIESEVGLYTRFCFSFDSLTKM